MVGLAILAGSCFAPSLEFDVLIYGGTSSGVIAAYQASRMGKSAAIVCPESRLGGLSASGLGYTDTGDKSVIGGLARDFYHRVFLHYQREEAWKWQKREAFGNRGQGIPAVDGENRTMWVFEPHVAEAIFESYVREASIPVFRGEFLDRRKGVSKQGAVIQEIRTLSGARYRAKVFIDATYEGDLMAAAKVSFTLGREARSKYGEAWAGMQPQARHHRHGFFALRKPVSPYIVEGDPKSGLLPRISSEPIADTGSGDRKIQAYCYRMCLTNVPDNCIPFVKPEGYDSKQYELLLRILNTGWNEVFDKFDELPNGKTDTNNHGPFSTDYIGMNYDYPEASYQRRREILKEHEDYQKGWLYFLSTDPRVPEGIRNRMSSYGLPKDEFEDTGGWPHQIYVREARRMLGSFVMTEHELTKKRPTPKPVGMGSYGIDSHNVQRYVTKDGWVENEGDLGVSTEGAYSIAYGAITPKKGEAANLLVPVAVSASHVAYGSIRMEPVFMVLGQSAAAAACLAIDRGIALQDLDYSDLRARLLLDGQVLEK